MPCIREIAIGNNNFGDSETLLRTEDRTNGTDDTAAERRKRKKIPAGREGEKEEGRDHATPIIALPPLDQHNENAQVECADFEGAIRETEAGSIDEKRWG